MNEGIIADLFSAFNTRTEFGLNTNEGIDLDYNLSHKPAPAVGLLLTDRGVEGR